MFTCFKKKPNSHVLLHNIIDKDLQKVLRPLNLVQTSLLCEKYTIRDNFITFNSYFYNFIAVLCTLLFRFVCLYLIIMPFKIDDDAKRFIYTSNICDYIFYSIGYLLNNFTNIIQSYNNILLVLKIQHVHRILKINGQDLKSLVICNWICVIFLYSFFIFNIIYICEAYPYISIIGLIATFATIAFDMNIVYALLVMKLMNKTLYMWIENLQKSRYVEDTERESYWKIMFDVYLNMQEAYKIIENAFRPLVSYCFKQAHCS